MSASAFVPKIDAIQYSNWARQRFEEWQRGGLDAVGVTLVYWENARETLSLIGRWHRLFDEHADLITPMRQPSDIEEARRSGRTAVFFGAQNCSILDDELALVSVMRQLGILLAQLTYNNQSLLGAGCYESSDGGLSRFGREVIREMNRVGMIVDLSHSGERTSLEAISVSERPVVISHANPKWFKDGLRNKSDRLLRALAQAGGLLGLSLYPHHLRDGSACSLSTFADMIVRVIDIVGPDQVGLGTDACLGWDYSQLEWMRSGRWAREPDFGEGSPDKPSWPEQPQWYRTPADFPRIAEGLGQRGLSDDQIGRIMGGNWFQFLQRSTSPQPAGRLR